MNPIEVPDAAAPPTTASVCANAAMFVILILR